jgi:methionyl-tRNA formyltransferase
MKIGIVSNSKICLPLLAYLNDNRAGVMLYLGQSAQPDFRLDEVIGFCRVRQIPVHIEDNKNQLYQWQQLHNPDVIFFSGYSHKVAVTQLGGVPKGIYNIHFGSLPQYRGPSPVFWQLKNGEAQIGITIHQMTNKLDSGAVVWEYNVKNEEYHTYNYINQLFSELQVRGVAEILVQLDKANTLDKKVQDERLANYYSKPQLADVVVNWDKMPAQEIISLIKACNSWNNGAISVLNGRELKILYAQVNVEKGDKEKPGTITIANNTFSVACINGSWLMVDFFNINNTCIPARHAGFYGLKTGQVFMSK